MIIEQLPVLLLTLAGHIQMRGICCNPMRHLTWRQYMLAGIHDDLLEYMTLAPTIVPLPHRNIREDRVTPMYGVLLESHIQLKANIHKFAGC